MLPKMMQKLFENGGSGPSLRADILPVDGTTLTINAQNKLEAKTSVTLSDAVDSDSSETAASSLAVKTAFEKAAEAQTAAGKADAKADAAQDTASAAQETADDALAKAEEALNGAGGGGAVTLSDAVDSDSSTTAASSRAVKTAYEKALSVQKFLEQAVDMGETAGDAVLDGTRGRIFSATPTAATTFSASGVEPGACLLLELHNAGAQVVTWAMQPRWAGGVAPLLAAEGRDLVALTHGIDGWYGVHVAADAR